YGPNDKPSLIRAVDVDISLFRRIRPLRSIDPGPAPPADVRPPGGRRCRVLQGIVRGSAAGGFDRPPAFRVWPQGVPSRWHCAIPTRVRLADGSIPATE